MDLPYDTPHAIDVGGITAGGNVQELTLADVMRLVESDEGLPPARRRHWLSSLRRIAGGIDRPPAQVLARLTSLRHPMRRLNAARMGIAEKSLANHRSNALAAVRYALKITDAPRRGIPLSPQWQRLLDAAPVKPRRLLSGLARYCSSRGAEPTDVTQEAVDAYLVHRAETSILDVGTATVRKLARAWNGCRETIPGWPDHRLSVPALQPISAGPPWEVFPEGLRAGIEAHLGRLAGPHRSANGRRRRPCKPSTVLTRRRELLAFARRAVATGIPVESLFSLEVLLAPGTVLRTFEAFLDEGGERPAVFVIDLAWKLHAIAREIGAPKATISQLDDIRARLEEERGPVMTRKNQAVIRTVMASDAWHEVIALPMRLMREAALQLGRSPAKAAATAALAIEILILTRAPIRVGNLLSIRLGENLVRPGGEGAPFLLTFPGYDTKNRVDLDFPLSPETSGLVQRYIDTFRPHLEGASASVWLFPGERGKRSARHASATIAERVEREIGIRITAHQFRHAAAAMILKQRPGEFEFVRRILGHLNVQTTIRHYTGLEAFRAGEQFAQLIEDRMADRACLPDGRKGKPRP